VIHVVVPVLNEARNVEGMIASVRERLEPLAVRSRLVLVDDGSTDGTGAVAMALSSAPFPVEVVTHARNLGPGAAFRTGFLHVLATAHPLDLVVTLEGDTTSDPSVLLRMLHRVWEQGDDIVLASCYAYGGGIEGTNVYRMGLSGVANWLMKHSLGLSGLHTLSSFYRVYQVSALQALQKAHGDSFITTHGFECMVEVLYRAARLRLRISEVPMLLDGSRRVGKSNMKVLKTSVAYLRLVALALAGRL
jgi:dolichol-phosphate mannosyltransferase